MQRQSKGHPRSTLPKRSHRRIPLSNNGSTTSSHATVSDDSAEDGTAIGGTRTSSSPMSFPTGTFVKKYFNGRGWTMGAVVKVLPNGGHEVAYDFDDGVFAQKYTYSYSKVARLTKTASVRTGTKLAIYWPHEKRYFTALITKELPRKRENYLICYCHNTVEREWIDLHRHRFRVVVPSSPYNDCVISKSDVTEGSSSKYVDEHQRDATLPPKEVNCSNLNQCSHRRGIHEDAASEEFLVSMSNMEEIGREVSLDSKLSLEETSKVTADLQESCASCDLSSTRQPLHLSNLEGTSGDKPNVIQPTRESSALRENVFSLEHACRENNPTDASGNIFGDIAKQNVQIEVNDVVEAQGIDRRSCHQHIEVDKSPPPRCISSPFDAERALKNNENTLTSTSTKIEGEISWSLDGGSLQGDAVVEQRFSRFPTIIDGGADDVNDLQRENNSNQIDATAGITDEQLVVSSKVSENDAESEAMENCSVALCLIDVGSRVEVYWPDDDCYYAGIVTKRRSPKVGALLKKPFFLVYDDNESEWIDFREHRFRVIEASGLQETCSEHKSTEIPSDAVSGSDDMPSNDKLTCIDSMLIDKKSNPDDRSVDKLPTVDTLLADAPCNAGLPTNSNVPIDEPASVNLAFESADATSGDVTKRATESAKNFRLDDETSVDEDHKNFVRSTEAAMKEDSAAQNTATEDHVPADCVSTDSVGLSDTMSSGRRLSSPRRTSRSIHPTKFFAHELNQRNNSDHTSVSRGDPARHEDDIDDCVMKSDVSDVDSNCNSAKSDKNREDRKAALDALVKKKRDVKHGGDDDSLDDVCRVSPSNSAEGMARLTEDLLNLQVGVRVSVWCARMNQYNVGVIADERDKKTRFLVEYDDAEGQEWINFEKTDFKILKRKRGRPKKFSRNTSISDGIDHNKDKKSKKTSTVITDRAADITIGSKVAVLWDEDGEYHNATVIRERSKGKPFFIEYDGTNVYQWIDFREKDFKLINQTPSNEKRSKTLQNDMQLGDVTKVHVGSHIAVWWAGEARYVSGIVTKIRVHARPFYVVYDDGESAHWVDLEMHKFKFLNDDDDERPVAVPAKRIHSDAAMSKMNDKKRQKVSADESKTGTLHDAKDDGPLSKLEVGSRIEIWWAGDSAYYAATVKQVGSKFGSFFIRYDDDEEEWIDLRKNYFRLVSCKNEKTAQSKTKSSSRKAAPDNDDSSSTEDTLRQHDGVYPDVDDDFVYGDVDKVKVGSRIAVWWTMDKVYYAGRVAQITDGRKPFFIKYDDNDEEWTDLRKRYFRFLDKK